MTENPQSGTDAAPSLDTLRASLNHLTRAIQSQLSTEWEQTHPAVRMQVLQEPGEFGISPWPDTTPVVHYRADLDGPVGEPGELATPDGADLDLTRAAALLDVDLTEMAYVLADFNQTLVTDRASYVLRAELATTIAALEADLPAGAPAPGGMDITAEQVAADWIASTTRVQAYLEAGRPDLAQLWVAELDENLTAFAEGGYPPGSDELYGIYRDAVAREAIPYGTAPLTAADTAQQLANVGITVAPLDVDTLRQQTDLTPLNRSQIEAVLAPIEEQAPAGAPDRDSDRGSGITIYTTPNCGGCIATKRALTKADVPFNEVDLSTQPDLARRFREQGLKSAPILEANGTRTSGFRPDKIKEATRTYQERQRRDGPTTEGGYGR